MSILIGAAGGLAVVLSFFLGFLCGFTASTKMLCRMPDRKTDGLTEAERDFLYLARSFSLADPNFAAIYAKLKPVVPLLDEWLRECECDA